MKILNATGPDAPNLPRLRIRIGLQVFLPPSPIRSILPRMFLRCSFRQNLRPSPEGGRRCQEGKSPNTRTSRSARLHIEESYEERGVSEKEPRDRLGHGEQRVRAGKSPARAEPSPNPSHSDVGSDQRLIRRSCREGSQSAAHFCRHLHRLDVSGRVLFAFIGTCLAISLLRAMENAARHQIAAQSTSSMRQQVIICTSLS
jgi:hypothetical protein